MRRFYSLSLLFCLAFNLFAGNIHHSVLISFNIDESSIIVVDEIDFPEGDQSSLFYLNKNLVIASKGVQLVDSVLNYYAYKLTDEGSTGITISYSGVIDDNKDALSQPPRHGVSSGTSGVIFDKGIYMSGQTYWLPLFEDQDPFTFNITATIDSAWTLTSQGTTISQVNEGSNTVFSIEQTHPTQQAYLIGNKWSVYETAADDVAIQAYLITPDSALATKYMGMTKRYLSKYEEMFGDYAYDKFALVENFWETGYGMPAFTLLGQRVIRMPWILYSSYPHELLHNYWGNGVFVDYDHGNWSEGLTTYFADFLFEEQKGEGVSYRHKKLKEYADYVRPENDFPLIDFKTRTSKASSAIGYGKSLMMFHMISTMYGREKLVESCRLFYDRYCFKEASFYDLQACIEETVGESLDYYFDQWVASTGVPSITLSDVDYFKRKKTVRFTLNQSGTAEPYVMSIPVRCILSDSTVVNERVPFDAASRDYSIKLASAPLSIAVDPDFEVMRLLHSEESPLTFSTIWGASDLTLVIPTNSPSIEAYKEFATSFQQLMARQRIRVSIINDVDVLPSSKNLVLLGADNIFSERFPMSDAIQEQAPLLKELSEMGTSLVAYKSQGVNVAQMNIYDASLVSLLLRKITHYGDFAYLGFSAGTAEIQSQGVFPITDTPMKVVFE